MNYLWISQNTGHKQAVHYTNFIFYTQQKLKKANFSNEDKVSLIIGAINDNNITSAAEAARIRDPNVVAAYLKNKTYQNVGISITPNKNELKKNDITDNRKLVPTTNYESKILSCKVCGLNGHDKRACRHKEKICNFCLKKGHIEKNCFHKKAGTSQNRKQNSTVVKETREIKRNKCEYLDNSSKFYKSAQINGISCNVFVDFGSGCSLMSRACANKLKLDVKYFETGITLSGFLGIGTVVNHYVQGLTEIDKVKLETQQQITYEHSG